MELNPYTYERFSYIVEARQLIGDAGEIMAVCAWLEEMGYPWLLGNALMPEELRPDGPGMYIDPESGSLVLRWPAEKGYIKGDRDRYTRIGFRYGDWIVFKDGGIRRYDDETFNQTFFKKYGV